MSVIELAPDERYPRGGDGRVDVTPGYQGSLARVMALVPAFRSARADFEAMPPVAERPALAPVVRPIMMSISIGIAVTGALTWAPRASWPAAALGAIFGIAAAASGDHLGAALRAVRDGGGWRERVVPIPAVLSRAAESVLVAVTAWLATKSVLAGFGLALLVSAATAIGYAAHIGHAAAELRAAARADAWRKVARSEQAIHHAVAVLRAAHAADLARITTEIDDPLVRTLGTADAVVPRLRLGRVGLSRPQQSNSG